jgi:hypothetical protein
MKQINEHVLTILANSGANLTLSTMLLMTLTLSLDLATRLIQVFTTKHGSDSVYCALALPHLENALHSLTNQMTHNRFSSFWQQHNHPEYPYTNKTPEILLDINPGESSPECTSSDQTTQSNTCNSLTPPCHSHNDVNEVIEDKFLSNTMPF